MINTFEPKYLDEIMNIWLNTNISAHDFIDKSYWENAADTVKSLLPASDLFIYQEENQIKGFVGVTDCIYIAGLFVKDNFQAQGIGRKLLEHCKQLYPRLELDVFAENNRAVQFYLKHGFSSVETKINPDFKRTEYHMVWSAEKTEDCR